MKKRTALKDCFWKVEIKENCGIYWVAVSDDYTGLDDDVIYQGGISSKSKVKAKQNWQRFARVNGWKKWEFV